MDMNFRRGLLRIAILTLPYFGWWAYKGWESYDALWEARGLREEALAADNLDAERYGSMPQRRLVRRSTRASFGASMFRQCYWQR